MPKDPDILVDLTTARTDFEAQVIVESLEAQGIPARAFTTAGTALPLDLGSTLPMRVAVRRRDLQKAAAALRAIRAESVDIDWDEVDVGERVPDWPDGVPRCESCGYELTGIAMGCCPECGTAETSRETPRRKSTNGRGWIWVIAIVALLIVLAYAMFGQIIWEGWRVPYTGRLICLR